MINFLLQALEQLLPTDTYQKVVEQYQQQHQKELNAWEQYRQKLITWEQREKIGAAFAAYNQSLRTQVVQCIQEQHLEAWVRSWSVLCGQLLVAKVHATWECWPLGLEEDLVGVLPLPKNIQYDTPHGRWWAVELLKAYQKIPKNYGASAIFRTLRGNGKQKGLKLDLLSKETGFPESTTKIISEVMASAFFAPMGGATYIGRYSDSEEYQEAQEAGELEYQEGFSMMKGQKHTEVIQKAIAVLESWGTEACMVRTPPKPLVVKSPHVWKVGDVFKSEYCTALPLPVLKGKALWMKHNLVFGYTPEFLERVRFFFEAKAAGLDVYWESIERLRYDYSKHEYLQTYAEWVKCWNAIEMQIVFQMHQKKLQASWSLNPEVRWGEVSKQCLRVAEMSIRTSEKTTPEEVAYWEAKLNAKPLPWRYRVVALPQEQS